MPEKRTAIRRCACSGPTSTSPPSCLSAAGVNVGSTDGTALCREYDARVIPRVPSIVRLHPVPVPHSNQATYVLDQDGRRWVAKREADMGTEAHPRRGDLVVARESHRRAGARRRVLRRPGRALVASRVVPDVSHWSGVIADRVSNPVALGAVLALDVWVLNEARRARNLVAQARADGRVEVWAIDADEAVVGHPADYAARLDEVPSVRNHARGLPLDRLVQGVERGAAAAAGLGLPEIEAMAGAACAVAGEPDAKELTTLVHRRAGAVPSLVTQYLRELRRFG